MNPSVDAVLSAAVWSDDAARRVVPHLPAEVIEGAARERLVDAVRSLLDEGVPVEPSTVQSRLVQAQGPGWDAALTLLIELLPQRPAGTLGWHLDRLQQDAARSRLRVLAGRLAQDADGAEPADAVALAREQLDRVDLGAATAPPTLADLTDAYLQALESGDTTLSLPTGFADLDALLSGGMRPGQLVVVGARPGVGKSVLLGDFARHAAQGGARVLLHSMEMPRQEVWDRHAAAVARVPLDRVSGKRLNDDDWSRIGRSLALISDDRLHVDDRPHLTVPQVAAHARNLHPDLLLVDYMQLIAPAKPSGSRQEDVAGISRGLKLLARDLRCPVVVAAQLNRSPVQRADTTPRLSDLRESGGIEADADIVLLLDRSSDDDMHGTTGTVHVAKNRNGPTGSVELAFLGHYASFQSLARWDGTS